MKLTVIAVAVLALAICPVAFGQAPASALDFAQWTSVVQADAASGSVTVTVAPCIFTSGSGVTFNPIKTDNYITFNDGASTETVLPSAVGAPTQASNVPGGYSCTATVSTTYAHKKLVKVTSGDGGVNEAMNYQHGGMIRLVKGWGSDTALASIPLTSWNGFLQDETVAVPRWYVIQPSVLTALATPATRSATAGATQVISGTATGTWTAVPTYVAVTYVDRMGGESPASASYNFTATVNVALNFASPAASTGAVGWRAYAGVTGTSTMYQLPITSTNCKLSSLTPYNTCAMGSAGVFTTPVTTTALAPAAGGVAATYRPNTQSHTTFAWMPSGSVALGLQRNYGPFLVAPALTAGQAVVVGAIPMPAGYLNYVGKTYRFSGDIATTFSTAATPFTVITAIGDTTDFTTGTPKTICSTNEVGTTGTVAFKTHFECTWTTNATGATGSIMPGGFAVSQVTAASAAGVSSAEIGTAAITADVLNPSSVYVVFTQTSGAESTTPPQLLDLHVEEL